VPNRKPYTSPALQEEAPPPKPEEMTWEDYARIIGGGVLRVGGMGVGAMGGFAVGGPPGAIVGGGLGGALSEAAVEKYIEPKHEVNPKRVLVGGALGAIPGSWMIRAGKPFVSAGIGAGISGASTVANKVAEGEDLKTAATNWSSGDLLGMLVGGATGGAFGKYSKPHAPAPTLEAVKTAVPPAPTPKSVDPVTGVKSWPAINPETGIPIKAEAPALTSTSPAITASDFNSSENAANLAARGIIPIVKKAAKGKINSIKQAIIDSRPSTTTPQQPVNIENVLHTGIDPQTGLPIPGEGHAAIADPETNALIDQKLAEGFQINPNATLARAVPGAGPSEATQAALANSANQRMTTQRIVANRAAAKQAMGAENAADVANIRTTEGGTTQQAIAATQAKEEVARLAQAELDRIKEGLPIQQDPSSLSTPLRGIDPETGLPISGSIKHVAEPPVDEAAALGGGSKTGPQDPLQILYETKKEAVVASNKLGGKYDIAKTPGGAYRLIEIVPTKPPEVPSTSPIEPTPTPEPPTPGPGSPIITDEMMGLHGQRFNKTEAFFKVKQLGGDSYVKQVSPTKWEVRFKSLDSQAPVAPDVSAEPIAEAPVPFKPAQPIVSEPIPVPKPNFGDLSPDEVLRMKDIQPGVGVRRTPAELAEWKDLYTRSQGKIQVQFPAEPPSDLTFKEPDPQYPGNTRVSIAPLSAAQQAALEKMGVTPEMSSKMSPADAQDLIDSYGALAHPVEPQVPPQINAVGEPEPTLPGVNPTNNPTPKLVPRMPAQAPEGAGFPGPLGEGAVPSSQPDLFTPPAPVEPQGAAPIRSTPDASRAARIQKQIDFALKNFSPEANLERERLDAIYNNPSTPPEIKRETGQALQALAQSEKQRLAAASKSAIPVEPVKPFEPPVETPSPTSDELSKLSPAEQDRLLADLVRKFKQNGEKGEIANQAIFRIAGGLGGAAVGATQTPEDPLKGALIGGTAGVLAPGAIRAAINAVRSNPNATQTEISEVADKVKGSVTTLGRMLPDWQRFSYLLDPINLPINVLVGPYGSALMGSIEHALQGDMRGLKALKLLLTTNKFLSGVKTGVMAGEAKHIIADVTERTEGVMGQAGPKSFRALVSSPAILMAAGDRSARRTLMDAGFSEQEARLITLTAEPLTGWGQGIAKFKKGAQTKGGIKSISANLALPFYRTAVNQMERSLERTPVIGIFAQRAKDVIDRDSRSAQIAQQTFGGGLAGASFLLGASMPGSDPRSPTNKVIRKFINEATGQYGTLVSSAFVAGLAYSSQKSPAGAVIQRLSSGDLPLPTTQPIVDVYNLSKVLTGEKEASLESLPGGLLPGVFRPNRPGSLPGFISQLMDKSEPPINSRPAQPVITTRPQPSGSTRKPFTPPARPTKK